VSAERSAGGNDWPAAINDPDARFALDYVDGSAAGVAKTRPDPTKRFEVSGSNCSTSPPSSGGTGVAAELLRWATDQVAADGAAVMRLRVVEAHHRARRFYEREGWEYDPDVPPSHNALFPLLCVRRSLTTGGTT
jgi:GNAT superfamily N-acetyltransferase